MGEIDVFEGNLLLEQLLLLGDDGLVGFELFEHLEEAHVAR